MADKKKERIKYVIVGVLSLVLVAGVYFRLIRGRTGKAPGAAAPAVAASPLEIPQVRIDPPEQWKGPESILQEFLPDPMRNLFSPPKKPARKEEDPSGEETTLEAARTLQLKGTIVGVKGAIAIIGERFVRTGEWIGPYRVARIGKSSVVLEAGNREVVLEILSNE
jgi:hypothetical protein